MSDNKEQRVLNRTGARYLSDEELNLIAGASKVTTTLCTVNPRNGHTDGDCD